MGFKRCCLDLALDVVESFVLHDVWNVNASRRGAALVGQTEATITSGTS
jgi:hypothetical protein